MDKNKYEAVRLRMERCAEALRRNNFAAECVDSKEEALELVEELLPDGATVAVGGSVTLSETGILPMLKSGRFDYIDRYAPGLTATERREVFLRSFGCDYYLCSANAVTAAISPPWTAPRSGSPAPSWTPFLPAATR